MIKRWSVVKMFPFVLFKFNLAHHVSSTCFSTSKSVGELVMMAQPVIILLLESAVRKIRNSRIWGSLWFAAHGPVSPSPNEEQLVDCVSVALNNYEAFCFSDNWCWLGTFLDSNTHCQVYAKFNKTVMKEEQVSSYNIDLLW